MKKLYKLKSWYTLQEAADRLSLTLGEPITENNVIQFAADGHIIASWFLNGAYCARKTKVYCDYPRKNFTLICTEQEYDENGECWGEYITGIFSLPVDLYPPWGWWFLTFIGKGGESGTLWDPIVIDVEDGSFRAFFVPHSQSDFMHFPPKEELVITRKDIEAFERRIENFDVDEPKLLNQTIVKTAVGPGENEADANIWDEYGLRRLWDESKAGMTHQKLADKYNVSRQRISALLAKAKVSFTPSKASHFSALPNWKSGK